MLIQEKKGMSPFWGIVLLGNTYVYTCVYLCVFMHMQIHVCPYAHATTCSGCCSLDVQHVRDLMLSTIQGRVLPQLRLLPLPGVGILFYKHILCELLTINTDHPLHHKPY